MVVVEGGGGGGGGGGGDGGGGGGGGGVYREYLNPMVGGVGEDDDSEVNFAHTRTHPNTHTHTTRNGDEHAQHAISHTRPPNHNNTDNNDNNNNTNNELVHGRQPERLLDFHRRL